MYVREVSALACSNGLAGDDFPLADNALDEQAVGALMRKASCFIKQMLDIFLVLKKCMLTCQGSYRCRNLQIFIFSRIPPLHQSGTTLALYQASSQ
jgi:hypothetical protein